MIAAIARRLAAGFVTVVLVVLIGFALLELTPGGPGSITEDPRLGPEDRARVKAALGLDRSPVERLAAYAGSLARGDLGISLSRHEPVSRVLARALPATLWLSGGALIVALGLGLVIGTAAALWPRSPLAWLARFGLPALDAVPPFWLGICAVLVFAWQLDWLPAAHMQSAAPVEGLLAALVDRLRHLALPVLVLGLPGAAPVARHHWASLVTALRSEHVRAARAAGLSEARVLWARAFPTALMPTVQLIGLGLPALVGGAVVVEVVFSWPGLGRIHQQALLARDVPLFLGGLILIGVLVVAGGILADLLSAWVDPRLRRRGSRP
jgi:ABC-type dipeptide/oligopeptide/nickel transport system permease component